MRINALGNTATDFASDDYIALDGETNGSRKMKNDSLMKVTAQNALADNVAPAFDALKPNDEGGFAYYAGDSVTHNGKNYVFVVNHTSGPWNFSEVEQKPISETFDLQGVGQAVQDWLNSHPEATTTVLDYSLTHKKLVTGTLNFVTPEMYGASGDGVSDDTNALNDMLSGGNKFCLFGSGRTYKVSGIIDVQSNTIINLNNSLILSIYDGHIIRFKGEQNLHKSNFEIRNGSIYGNGLNNHVGDQGAGIQGIYADNIIIENINISHTYGDGLQFRSTNNVNVKRCKIEYFGRNGVSPTSGNFVFDHLIVTRTSLTGANPGNPFDCEPNAADEPAVLEVKNSYLPRATLVDFYSAEDADFIIEATFDNVVFDLDYPCLKVVKSRKGSASGVLVKNCLFNVDSDSFGLWVEKVTDLKLENCRFTYVENAGANTHAIIISAEDVTLSLKNVDCSGLRRSIFAYNKDIVGWTFDGFKGRIYTRIFKDNIIKNSNIEVFETTASESDNTGNVYYNCEIPQSLREFAKFGSSSSSFGSMISTNEFIHSTAGSFEVFIPLPAIDESLGHCYFLSIGYSHRGRTNLSGQKLFSVLAQENDAGATITEVFSIGDKNISVASASGKRGLIATFDATPMNVSVSYTLFG